jgi:hypothetical protein
MFRIHSQCNSIELCYIIYNESRENDLIANNKKQNVVVDL